MADSASKSNSKKYVHQIGDLVWGKVKGYNFWPGEIISGDDCPVGRGKAKATLCVRFFDAGNYAWLGEESIKPYEQFRAQYTKISKAAAFRTAMVKADEKLAVLTGKAPEPLNTTANTSAANISVSTPNIDKSTPTVFSSKAKKSNATSSTPVQRDYSRTPFKAGPRRAVETPDEKEVTKSSSKSDLKREASPLKSSESPVKKSVKIVEPSPKKIKIDSPTKPKVNDFKDDLLSEGPSFNTTDLVNSKATRTSSVRPSNLKFGFIGLGNMGQQVLRNLLQAGHEISIWNRTPAKCKEFEKAGANVMKTPGDVIRESDITFSCLSDAEASSKIFFGNCGVSQEINASKGYVELTSMDPTTSIDIEETIKKRGGRYLEAPLISSIPKQIDEGQLVAMAAGNRSLFDDCGSCFQSICAHVYFLSEEAGTAAKMNLVIATLHGNILGALMESTSLAERLGLMPKDFVEIVVNSPFSSALVESKSKAIVDSTLMKDIPFAHILRDLKYTLELSNKNNYSTPITSITNEVFKQKQHHYF